MKKNIALFSFMFLLVFSFCDVLTAETSNEMSSPEEAVMLEETVVVATREAEEIVRIPGNVTVITSEDIEKSTAKEITEILRKESGIMVTNTSGSTPTGITVEARGFNNGGGNGGRTLVLVDGWKANRADTNNPDWALIPLDNIERIEIIRGPASAVYGDSAMAGVINIITKRGEGRPAVNLSSEVGSYQRYGQRATFQGQLEKFKYFLYGEYGMEDGYRDNSNFRASDMSGKFSYQLSTMVNLTAKLGYHNDDREFPGALTKSEISIVGRRGSMTPADGLDVDQYNFGLGTDITPDENNKFSIQFYFNTSERESLSSIPGSGSTSINDDEDNYNLALRYSSNHTLCGRENKTIFGIDLLQEKVDSTSFSNYPNPPLPYIQRQATDYDRELIGVYFHDSFSIFDKLVFDAGLRYDRGSFDYSNKTEDLANSITTTMDGDKDFSRYSPKAAITYLFTDDVSAYFSYAKTFRFPNRDELTGFFGFTSQLDPEKGENFEIGMKTRFGPDFNGGISLYHMKVEDEIIYRPPTIGSFFFGQNENFDEVIHEGIEISVDTSILPKTTVFGSYTFVDTEIEDGPFEGSELPITPRHMGTLGATVDLGYGFSLWNQARFVGKRYLASDLSNTMDKLSGYGVWDTKVSYEYTGRLGTLSAFFGVNNILNKGYHEYGGVGGFPFGSRVGYYPSPERNFLGGITLKHNFSSVI